MSEENNNGAPSYLKIVAIIAIIWNALGAMNYIMQAMMTPEIIATLPEAEQALYQDIPAWVTAAFAFAVWGGLAGSIGLLMKKSWSFIMFVLSLIGIVVQMSFIFFMSGSLDVYGPGAAIMPLMILAIGVYLIYLANQGKNDGWLN